ncbi:MAG TPA: type VI secretion system tip protein TssI/VgrG [Terriglobales bacterium]
MPDQTYTQDYRLLAIDTPLGKDALLLQELTGFEGISRLFSYELDLLAYDNDSLAFNDIVGQQVGITLHQPDGSSRYINGFISRFTQGETDDRLFTHYHAQVVPWLWFLTRQADCRIFQNLSVPDIINQVFGLFSFSDFRMNVQGSYPQLEYCVQYRETSFNFVSRLMEEAGIFYYFDHSTEGKHTLVLSDQSNALPQCPSSPISYDTEVGGLDDPEVINNWHVGQEVRTGKYTVTDYNFTTPSTSLLANEPTVVNLSASQDLELFDYPGIHTTKSDGDNVAKLRMQEEEAAHMVISGAGNCRGLMSGYSFELQNHYRADQNDTYVVTEVRHFASAGQTYSSAGAVGAETYSNHFTCIPSSVAYRPPRITPKPFVQGPQPALVVGPSGEEIWVDKYGRVIVQFYWDRQGQKNENSSCWIRTSQPWAGGNWGAMWIPRIGQEVLVSFLEGDPDRPIITGRVYNADQMPPYTLPDHQTVSTFQSRSSKGGGSSNFNEIRFEDKQGSEQIFINAERDMDHRVENDSREYVMANRHLTVGSDQIEQVQGDKHLQVLGDHLEKITGDMSLQVTGDQKEKVGGGYSLQVASAIDEKVGTKRATEAGQEIHLKAGMKVIIEAGMQISLVGPGGFVDIGPAGVTIQGTMVLINSGGAAGSGSGASPQDPKDPKDPDEADDGSKFAKAN